MIFYGTRTTSIDTKKISAVCSSCSENNMHLNVQGTYAHVMWIPSIPFGKRVYSWCGHCQNYLSLREMPQDLKHKAKEFKSQTSYPKWFYSGIFIMLVFLGSLFFTRLFEKVNLPDYVKTPQIEDIYYIEEVPNEYTSFKVNQVDSDSLYVFWNTYYVEKSYDIKDIDISKNYDTKAYGISRVFIDSVYEAGKIIKIKR